MRDRSGKPTTFLLMSTAVFLIASCNAAVGGGLVVLAGGAGFLAGQCYDRVRVRVRDPRSGLATCSADVWVSEGGGSERRLRPCYSAALTEGTWKLTARQAGYAPATTELTIPGHEGECPHYTHSVELTLRQEGEPSSLPMARSRLPSGPAPSAPASPASASDLESPPARVVPPPIPTRSFAPVPVTPATTAPAVPPAPPTPLPPAPPTPAPPTPLPPAPPTPAPAPPPASAPAPPH
jgi:hypothetical protein